MEELDTDLPRGSLEFIKFGSHGNDDRFWIVSGDAVGDDDDIEGFDRIEVVFLGFAFAEIGSQNSVKASSRGSAAAGAYSFENTLHVYGVGDVLVRYIIAGVEEVDVDTVFVVGGADGCDGCEGGGSLAPGTAGHGAGVVDQEDGVEGGKEGIGVIG